MFSFLYKKTKLLPFISFSSSSFFFFFFLSHPFLQDRATERLKQAPNILPANALSEAFEKSNDDGGGAAAAAGALSSADLRADTLKLATSLKFATEM